MEELLSLKWNNHCSAFLKILSTVRTKQKYTDVTLACSGKFYGAHKLVLSMCSDYFEEMFQQTNDKHLMVVLKDIGPVDLELLLDYMYLGEVSVKQADLASLLKAAECLQIKGLAVADDEPSKTSSKKVTSPVPSKKRKMQDNIDYDDRVSSHSYIKARRHNKHKSYIAESNEEVLQKQEPDNLPIQIKEEVIQPEAVCIDDIFKEEEYIAENVSSPLLPESHVESKKQIMESSTMEPINEEVSRFPSTSFQDESSEWPNNDSNLNYPTSSDYNPPETRDQVPVVLSSCRAKILIENEEMNIGQRVVPLPSLQRRLLQSKHMPELLSGNEAYRRCRLPGCKKFARAKCIDCNVYLCLVTNRNCFKKFHQ